MFEKFLPFLIVFVCLSAGSYIIWWRLNTDITTAKALHQECQVLCGTNIIYSCSDDLAVCVAKEDLKYYPKQK